jgi:hypothetical protein
MSEGRLKTEPGSERFDPRRLEVAKNLTAAIHSSLANLTPVPGNEALHPSSPPLSSDVKLHHHLQQQQQQQQHQEHELHAQMQDQVGHNFSVDSLMTAAAIAAQAAAAAASTADHKDSNSRDGVTPPSPQDDLLLQQQQQQQQQLQQQHQQGSSSPSTPLSYHRAAAALANWSNSAAGPINGESPSAQDLSPESSSYNQDSVIASYHHLHQQQQQQQQQHFDLVNEGRNISSPPPGHHQLQMSPTSHAHSTQSHFRTGGGWYNMPPLVSGVVPPPQHSPHQDFSSPHHRHYYESTKLDPSCQLSSASGFRGSLYHHQRSVGNAAGLAYNYQLGQDCEGNKY